MAVISISRIQQRRGILEDLRGVNLSAGEFGWAMDQRRLFIGNGEVSEGAAVPGNTEVMTEASPLFDRLPYRYLNRRFNGSTGQMEPSTIPGWVVPRPLQERLDDRVSIQSYGVRGDGGDSALQIEQETLNMRRAVYDLFGHEPAYGKALHFPAGIYLINQPLPLIDRTVLTGDGMGRTIIILDDLNNWTGLADPKSFVVGTAQFIGESDDPNVATESWPMSFDFDATAKPAVTDISVSGITFVNRNPEGHVARLRNCDGVAFYDCELLGDPAYRCDDDPYLQGTKLATDTRLRMAAVKIEGPARDSLVTGSEKPPRRITLQGCRLAGRMFGVSSIAGVQQVAIRDSQLENLYDGVNLGESETRWGVPNPRPAGSPFNTIHGPTGVVAINCFFNNIIRYGFAVFTPASGNGTIGCRHEYVGGKMLANCQPITGTVCDRSEYECVFFYNDGFAAGAVGNFVISDSFFRDDLTQVNCPGGSFLWYDPVTNAASPPTQASDRPTLPRVYNENKRNLVILPGLQIIQVNDFYIGSIHITPINSIGLVLPPTGGVANFQDVPDGRNDAEVVEFSAATYNTMFFEYSLRQGTNRKLGVIKVIIDHTASRVIQFDDLYEEPYDPVTVSFRFFQIGTGSSAKLRVQYSNGGAEAIGYITMRIWRT